MARSYLSVSDSLLTAVASAAASHWCSCMQLNQREHVNAAGGSDPVNGLEWIGDNVLAQPGGPLTNTRGCNKICCLPLIRRTFL
ncbi:hypothetical protein F4677DRAFT_408302 [Hypoxylon crocopeplum]|nr:hypothetical protein F4677DRAFT_408302 [Hypoxylon crocopeplum]